MGWGGAAGGEVEAVSEGGEAGGRRPTVVEDVDYELSQFLALLVTLVATLFYLRRPHGGRGSQRQPASIESTATTTAAATPEEELRAEIRRVRPSLIPARRQA